MSETPASPDPGRDATPPGAPAGPGDYPWLGSPDWTLVPDSAEWPAWMGPDAHWDDEHPGDPDQYQDPDNAPPPGLDDGQLAALISGGRAAAAGQARAAKDAARPGHTAVRRGG